MSLLLFYVVVTAENMSGAAMYELVSRNITESKLKALANSKLVFVN